TWPPTALTSDVTVLPSVLRSETDLPSWIDSVLVDVKALSRSVIELVGLSWDPPFWVSGLRIGSSSPVRVCPRGTPTLSDFRRLLTVRSMLATTPSLWACGNDFMISAFDWEHAVLTLSSDATDGSVSGPHFWIPVRGSSRLVLSRVTLAAVVVARLRSWPAAPDAEDSPDLIVALATPRVVFSPSRLRFRARPAPVATYSAGVSACAGPARTPAIAATAMSAPRRRTVRIMPSQVPGSTAPG